MRRFPLPRRWRHWPLTAKFAAIAAVSAALPLCFAIVYNIVGLRTRSFAAVDRQNAIRAAGTARALERQLASYRAAVHVAASATRMADFLQMGGAPVPSDASSLLLETAVAFGFEAVYVTDRRGLVMAASREGLVGRSDLTAAFFRDALAGREVLEGPRYDLADQGLFLHASAPVQTADGRILGTAVGRFSLEILDLAVRSDTDFDGRGSGGMLWDDLGIRLSASDPTERRLRPLAPLRHDVRDALGAEGRFGPDTERILEETDDYPSAVAAVNLARYDPAVLRLLRLRAAGGGGVTRFAMASLPERRWIYAVGTPERAILKELRRQTMETLLAGILILAAALTFALSAAASLARPLRRLAQAADGFAAGDLSRRIALTQDDEAGRLAKAFDRMAEALQRHENERSARLGRMENTVRDSTEALVASDEKLCAIFGALTDSVSVMDAAGRVVEVAPTLAAVSLAPFPVSDGSAAGETVERLRDAVREALASRKSVTAEIDVRFEGLDRWFSCVVSPFRGGQAVAAARDITDQRLLRERMLQSQKMEIVGRLAGGIAHDFNNLLTVIMGHATFAQDRLPHGSPALENLAEVVKAAQRAAKLTQQLLLFARRKHCEKAAVDVNALVAGLEGMLQRLIGETVTLSTGLQADPSRILADPGQIEQVLVNLVVNARDAMPRGGILSIKTGNETVVAGSGGSPPDLDPGDYVLITVIDTGIGMDGRVMARLFEPFFTTKEIGKGTRLGLATLWGIVKEHGGTED